MKEPEVMRCVHGAISLTCGSCAKGSGLKIRVRCCEFCGNQMTLVGRKQRNRKTCSPICATNLTVRKNKPYLEEVKRNFVAAEDRWYQRQLHKRV